MLAKQWLKGASSPKSAVPARFRADPAVMSTSAFPAPPTHLPNKAQQLAAVRNVSEAVKAWSEHSIYLRARFYCRGPRAASAAGAEERPVPVGSKLLGAPPYSSLTLSWNASET